VLIAGGFTVIVFSFDKREPSGCFYWLLGIGLLAQVLSVISGCTGLGDISGTHNYFVYQAGWCIGGVFAIAASFFFLGPSIQEVDQLATEKLLLQYGERIERLEAIHHESLQPYDKEISH